MKRNASISQISVFNERTIDALIQHDKSEEYTVTSIYELVRKCDPMIIADQLNPIPVRQKIKSSREHKQLYQLETRAQTAFRRKLISFIVALNITTPDLSQAVNEPIDPYKSESLRRLSEFSWPKALGSRVIMPNDGLNDEWDERCAMVIGHIFHSFP